MRRPFERLKDNIGARRRAENVEDNMQYGSSIVRVDLDRLRRNMALAMNGLPDGVKVWAVVKANAYGHGASGCAKAALDVGAYGLAVANLIEGRLLRGLYPKVPILVLGPSMPYEMEEMASLDIWPAVFYPEQVERLAEAALRLGRPAGCHLALDTGMNRIGARTGETLDAMLKAFKEHPQVHMCGVFSHLYAADGGEKETEMQAERFRLALEKIHAEGFEPMAHLANSAALMYRPELHFDAVRFGIGMYGLEPWDRDERLLPVMTWATHIAHLHTLPEGETVSYGGIFRADRDMRIATLPVGYADGYPRALSGKGAVLIHGRRARILGRICMDQMMVDVSEIPDAKLGDEAVLLGEQDGIVLPAQELADACGTLHYEIVTNAGRRAPREFLHEQP